MKVPSSATVKEREFVVKLIGKPPSVAPLLDKPAQPFVSADNAINMKSIV